MIRHFREAASATDPGLGGSYGPHVPGGEGAALGSKNPPHDVGYALSLFNSGPLPRDGVSACGQNHSLIRRVNPDCRYLFRSSWKARSGDFVP